jgi:DNA-binding MarR family transcriptional regulator
VWTRASGNPRPLLPELARSPGHVLWRAAAKVTFHLDASLPPRIDFHSYAVLLALAPGQARSQQWLADTVVVSRTTMAKVLTALVDEGLVERVRNPEDLRANAVTRTEQAASVAEQWRHNADEVEAAISDGLAPAELTELRSLVRLVVEPGLMDGTPEELRSSLAFLVTRLHRRVHADALVALRDLQLEPRFMGTLIILRKLGRIPQAELARHLGISTPSVVQIVDGMEAAGLVERHRDADDRRTQRLHLTARATPVGDEARDRLTAITERHLEVLDVDERERLLELLVLFVDGG